MVHQNAVLRVKPAVKSKGKYTWLVRTAAKEMAAVHLETDERIAAWTLDHAAEPAASSTAG